MTLSNAIFMLLKDEPGLDKELSLDDFIKLVSDANNSEGSARDNFEKLTLPE